MENSKQNKKITIGDVADALGVSKTTVSRAISGKGRIGAETKERVLKYIEEHNYKPNIIAKGLAQSKTYNLGVVVTGDYNIIDLPFFQSCLMGVCDLATRMDYDVLVSIVSENDISQLKRVITNNKVDGIILTRTFVKDNVIEYLMDMEVPFVTIGNSEYENVIQIDNNHREACKELTSILLMNGLRRIALIGGNTTHYVTQNRYLGYVEAHENLNLPIDHNLVYMDANNNVVIEKIVRELLVKDIECILCMDDSICISVLNKLKKEHIKVPEHMKVASFYNSAMLENNIPSITSLKFNALEVGMVACQTLLDRLDEKEVDEKTLLGYEVVLRESTKI